MLCRLQQPNRKWERISDWPPAEMPASMCVGGCKLCKKHKSNFQQNIWRVHCTCRCDMASVFLLSAICICASIQMDPPLVMVERKVIGQRSALCNVTKGLSSSPGASSTHWRHLGWFYHSQFMIMKAYLWKESTGLRQICSKLLQGFCFQPPFFFFFVSVKAAIAGFLCMCVRVCMCVCLADVLAYFQ